MTKKIAERLFKYAQRTFLKTVSGIVKKTMPKEKKDQSGIVYVYGFRRYLSMLLDMTIIVSILFVFNATMNLLVKDEKTYVAMEKYSMDIRLTSEEKALKERYIFWYVYVGQSSQIIGVLLYTAFLWHRFSATPGKIIMGLRVVDADTLQSVSFSRSLKRVFSTILSILPVYMGVFWSRFDKRAQSWHDKISGTVVVTNKSLKLFRSKAC